MPLSVLDRLQAIDRQLDGALGHCVSVRGNRNDPHKVELEARMIEENIKLVQGHLKAIRSEGSTK